MAKNKKTSNDILSENESILNRLTEDKTLSSEDLIKLRNNNQSLKTTINGMNWIIDIGIVATLGLIFLLSYNIYESFFNDKDVNYNTEYKVDSLRVKKDSIVVRLDSVRQQTWEVISDKQTNLVNDYRDVLNENFKLKNEIYTLKDSLQDYKIFNEIAENNYKLKYIKLKKGKTTSYSVESSLFDKKIKEPIRKVNDTISK